MLPFISTYQPQYALRVLKEHILLPKFKDKILKKNTASIKKIKTGNKIVKSNVPDENLPDKKAVLLANFPTIKHKNHIH